MKFFCLVASLALLLIPGAARAASEHVHGVVLGVTPASGEAIVRHDPFGGMPAMTMPFRLVPRERAAELQPGNTIDATVDTSTDPWTLHDVTVSTSQRVVSAYGIPHVTPLRVGDLVPDTPFVDQSGRPFRFSQLRGHDVVLAFIYTRCADPHMCPLISAKFNALQRQRGTRNVRLVEVTLDPAYDRPPVLARYGRAFGANPAIWTLAVGDAAATLDFAARFGIYPFPDPNVGIIHAENTVEIDPDGRIQTMLTDTSWQPAEILADVDAREHLAANPFARFVVHVVWLIRGAYDAVAGAMSGVGDLVAAIAIFAALCYLLFRLARGILAKRA